MNQIMIVTRNIRREYKMLWNSGYAMTLRSDGG